MSQNLDIIHLTTHPSPPSTDPPLLIYLISGNPGVITFYKPFLTHLFTLLTTTHPTRQITIHARSLSGFEISPTTPRPPHPPFTLTQQIHHVASKITSTTSPGTQVVLLGHSVGAYILFEILRLYHEGKLEGVGGITAGICLFPTIADLAKSPRGRWASKVLSVPGIWIPLVLLARVITLWGWGSGVLIWGLVHLLGMEESRVQGMVGWFGSDWGVREAVVMARCEFAQMLDDTWSDEVWQVSKQSNTDRKRTKLFFYWGKDDYWVDSVNTRDRIIRARGEIENVVMEVDTHGIDHAFCLEEEGSKIVAGKIAGYIDTLL